MSADPEVTVPVYARSPIVPIAGQHFRHQFLNSPAKHCNLHAGTGRSLKVDPGGAAQTQSTFSGEGEEFGFYFEAVSMHAEGPGFETQSTFTL